MSNIRCLVDGCEWRMEAETELREDGESHIDLHLNTHTVNDLQNAARNGMLFAFCEDPLQTETAIVYVKGFLQWVAHQNSIVRDGGEAPTVTILSDTSWSPAVIVPLEPTEEDIGALIEGFIETDYRFGN